MAGIPILTLVEVGECFIMQFNGGRGSCTQNILKGKDLILAVWRQAGLFLLEDGEGKYIAGEQRQYNSAVSNMSKPDYLIVRHSLLPFQTTSLQKMFRCQK